jgi:hypothetical protein
MMSVVKTVVGLCLGIALFSALQAAGVRTLQDYIRSGNANGGLPIGTNTPIATSFDADAPKNGILPKFAPIDTTEGQRLGVESAARRVDMQIRNAQSRVPRF